MNPGIYTMPANEYFGIERVSCSYLKRLGTVPANAKQEYKTTPSMTFGTACHSYVLEPDKFDDQVAVAQKLDRRTKKGKEAYAEFCAESQGKVVISADEMETVRSMSKAIQAHPMASKLLSSGVAEQSIIFTDTRTELPCKARADWITNDAIVDLKTTKNASQYGFLQEVIRYGYHIQAGFYLSALNAVSDKEYSDFLFIAAERVPPFRVETYALSDEFVEAGYFRYQELLDLEILCQKEGFYPHYASSGIVELQKPGYI